MIKSIKILIFILLSFYINSLLAQDLPEKVVPFNLSGKIIFNEKSTIVRAINPLLCPLRLKITFQNEKIQKQFKRKSSVTIAAKDSFDFIIKCNRAIPNQEKPRFRIDTKFGDPYIQNNISNEAFSLPFINPYCTVVMQGYNGAFSHSADSLNKYAIDFKTFDNDPICATADGYVVGVVEKYSEGGTNKTLMDYVNKITIYHPSSKTFSEYVHLIENGSLVHVGDKVKQGQVIGLAGNTGYSTECHLHFVVMIPVDTELGFKSIPITFKEGYEGNKLKPGMIVYK